MHLYIFPHLHFSANVQIKKRNDSGMSRVNQRIYTPIVRMFMVNHKEFYRANFVFLPGPSTYLTLLILRNVHCEYRHTSFIQNLVFHYNSVHSFHSLHPQKTFWLRAKNQKKKKCQRFFRGQRNSKMQINISCEIRLLISHNKKVEMM